MIALTSSQKMSALDGARDPGVAAVLRRHDGWAFGRDAAGWYAEWELPGVAALGGGHVKVIITGETLGLVDAAVSTATIAMVKAGITGRQGAT